MKKRLITLFFSVFALSGFILSDSVSAHVLKTDGDIGAIMHINPDDNPLSGTPTTYSIAFKDTTNRFSLSNCGCNVSFTEDNKIIYTEPLTQIDELDSANYFTFPKADVYTMTVTGKPKMANAFQPFILSYLIRVQSDQSSATAQPFPLTLGIGIALGIGLMLLAMTRLDKIL
jgi:hypothetical protein